MERVEYEFEILKSKGVIDYFVMLGDVIRWAKLRGSGLVWGEVLPPGA